MRWFVGDIHGCARELDDLLGAIRFDPDSDELWLTGDLVNRGPDSAAALRLARDLGGHGVLGNHDLHALRSLAGEIAREPDDTLDDLRAAPDGGELLAFLATWPGLRLLPGGPRGTLCLVHAGIHPRWSDLPAAERDLAPALELARARDERIRFATLARCCTADGGRVRARDDGGCEPPSLPWDAHYAGAPLVVHGHWAQRGLYRTERVLGLDSGCAWGGALTAWNAEEDRIVQVPARR